MRNDKQEDCSISKRKFNPLAYKGILSDLNLDIERELELMRKEWERDVWSKKHN